MTLALLDNIAWHTLAGPHARFADGDADARRYARGFSPIIGFADVLQPRFVALAACCAPGEHFYCDGWRGRAPDGWRVEEESTMFKMVWDADVPEGAMPEAVRLRGEHAAAAVDLAARTRPGPFGPRTIELGDYFGCFVEGRLVAMAGERMTAGRLREISGVCTAPEHQGRGLARGLVHKLLRRQLRRGETPFLHVMRENVAARRLYERMGFRVYREAVVRVVARC